MFSSPQSGLTLRQQRLAGFRHHKNLDIYRQAIERSRQRHVPVNAPKRIKKRKVLLPHVLKVAAEKNAKKAFEEKREKKERRRLQREQRKLERKKRRQEKKALARQQKKKAVARQAAGTWATGDTTKFSPDSPLFIGQLGCRAVAAAGPWSFLGCGAAFLNSTNIPSIPNTFTNSRVYIIKHTNGDAQNTATIFSL